jgi:hypothetical protein
MPLPQVVMFRFCRTTKKRAGNGLAPYVGSLTERLYTFVLQLSRDCGK